MSQETTYAGLMGDLERLIAALAANAGDLPQLEGARLHMEQLLNQTREALREQAALIASKQDASQRVLRLIGDGGDRDRGAQDPEGALRSQLGEARRVRSPALPRPQPPDRPGTDDPAAGDRQERDSVVFASSDS